MDLRDVSLLSDRLSLKSFTAGDAVEAFAAVTPTLTRYLRWEPSPSLEAFASVWQGWPAHMAAGEELIVVVRLRNTGEFLGMAGLHHLQTCTPEPGIWIKESAHGAGYGREAVATLVAWGTHVLNASAFIYPVVEQNHASRRIPESLHGTIIGADTQRKPGGIEHKLLVYRIPAKL